MRDGKGKIRKGLAKTHPEFKMGETGRKRANISLKLIAKRQVSNFWSQRRQWLIESSAPVDF